MYVYVFMRVYVCVLMYVYVYAYLYVYVYMPSHGYLGWAIDTNFGSLETNFFSNHCFFF